MAKAHTCIPATGCTSLRMGLPQKPAPLTVEQVKELNNHLSTMRHDINNHLSLIVAAVEMIRLNPESAAGMVKTLAAQPAKITQDIARFTADFERLLGITRP